MTEEYYACFSRETQEIDGERRIGLEFEVVETSKLRCFLEGQAGYGSMLSGKYGEIFKKFQKFGVTDERFREVKVHYLGETGFHFVTVYFNDMEYARYVYENWYFIRLSYNAGDLEGDIYECAFYEWEETGDPQINTYCNLEVLPESEARTLRQLYTPYIPKESRIEADKKKEIFGAIAAGTIFSEVDFFYVGAALCVELLNIGGNIAAFFDLGTRVSANPLLAAQQPAAANSNAAILAHLGAINAGAPQTIFISHWHRDHCNALGNFIVGGVFANANIAGNTEWYVPGSGLASFTAMQQAVPIANFNVYPAGAAHAPANVNGNPNITVGKINLAGNVHPHHQGVYVQLTLVSGTTVFFPGDTTYEGIPAAIRTRGGAGYDVLQACHHGGDYYLPPANQNAVTAQGNIPTPAAAASNVFSADGIYHGHPNPFFILQYQNQGYAAANEEYLHIIAAGGNSILPFQ